MSKTVNIQDVIDLLLMNREEEYKKSLSAEYKHKSIIRSKHDAHVAFCDYLIECVKQLSSAQPQWIPCSKRLPEEKTDVLIAFKNNMVVGFWEDILNDGSVVWYANSGDGWLTQAEADYNDGIPLAWMPLPEPWKEG